MFINDTLISTPTIFKRSLTLMGSRFEISVAAGEEDEGWANNCIDAAFDEIRRIENLFAVYSSSSPAYLINANAGIKPVKVSKEMFDIIHRSVKLSELTQGAYDISYRSKNKRLWNFYRSMKLLRDERPAKKMARLNNYRNIILDNETSSVFLKGTNTRIGFEATGKGYAAERAKYILKQNGVESGIIDAAGDLTAWGCQPNGKPWTIGIDNPGNTHHPISYLNISNMTVVTSVNQKKYAVHSNRKAALPAQGIKSIVVINPQAEIANAMSATVSVLGIKIGLDIINHTKNTSCIIIDEGDKIFSSKNINLL